MFFEVISAIKIALNFCFYYNLYWNLLLVNSINNKFINISLETFIEKNGFLTLIFGVFFYTFTLGLTTTPILEIKSASNI